MTTGWCHAHDSMGACVHPILCLCACSASSAQTLLLGHATHAQADKIRILSSIQSNKWSSACHPYRTSLCGQATSWHHMLHVPQSHPQQQYWTPMSDRQQVRKILCILCSQFWGRVLRGVFAPGFQVHDKRLIAYVHFTFILQLTKPYNMHEPCKSLKANAISVPQSDQMACHAKHQDDSEQKHKGFEERLDMYWQAQARRLRLEGGIWALLPQDSIWGRHAKLNSFLVRVHAMAHHYFTVLAKLLGNLGMAM